jgi:NIPSNAP
MWRLLVIASLGLGMVVHGADTQQPTPGYVATPVHQLRIYQIYDNNKSAFHARFRDHAARIMAKYDFKIVAMWESKTGDKTFFVYLLEWPDVQTMHDRWAKFMADKEWSDIKKATAAKEGNLADVMEDRTLILLDYSPQKSLLGHQ